LIQEGLPFTIDDVKRQTEDDKLVSDINVIAEKYNGKQSYCHDVKEYNNFLRYLISIVVFNHFQRPSVAENLTIDEFVRAKQAKDGRWIVLVYRRTKPAHKDRPNWLWKLHSISYFSCSP